MSNDNQHDAPRSLVRWSFAVAIAGFLFGFDTAVISGADQAIQRLWQTSDLFHGAFIMSSALWGTVVGALFGNLPCDTFGRKPTLIAIGVLYLLSAVGTALAVDPYTFSALRFVGGLGVGVSSIAVPAYISEIAPAERRGRLVALYQFQIVFGILIAFLSNYVLSSAFGLDWRWMLGIEALPAVLYLAAIARVPESPRWLLLKGGRDTEAFAIVRSVSPRRADEVIAEIRGSLAGATDRLFARRYRLPILLAVLIAFFNQLSGINFVIYFAPRIFGLAGLDDSAALLSTTGVGLVNLLFTLLGVYLIDRAGRRMLMTLGSIGYLVSLSAVAWSFYTGASGIIVVLFVFLFIAAHAIGQGAVIWVFIAEIFPNTVRSKGQSLGSGTHWVLAATIALLMPYALSAFEAHSIFGFFAAMMLLQLAFVLIVMPETRGRTLESVAEELTNR